MELLDAIHGAATCRFYRPDPVPDDVLLRVLDAARFAPSGGNRQPLRLIVVRDPAVKAQLAEWYRVPWKAYVAAARTGAIRTGGRSDLVGRADHFADHLQDVPVLIVVCAEWASIHPTDHELGRISVVGGASIYPAVQNILLKAREEGLGAALTTLLCHNEAEVKNLLSIPDGIITAALLAMGWPAQPIPAKLQRRPLSHIVSLEKYGDPFPAAPA